ncbi:major facilitator superfamily domain-containing protein [Colletotrichum phormii]|uniref:Major facilitator superfamily domain-containing protein n=1 Tax=Colletotrichum phormii TaxID=359342 RepID=A0AAJ0EBQ1_9PEZI|nr:major facilitator superfamily domain-containing protein [Colletotrichum phormii]KAK1623867.1 major facilitator superfamily domain-containing protein [Colletotrichum phormii]
MDSIKKKTSRDEAPETNDGNQDPASPEYVGGLPLVCILIGLTLAVFCLSLDRTILATAVPKITTEFNSLNDVAWYGSSYLLTTCCFQLMFGKLYAEFRVTWVFLAALVFFELGTIVCATAPNSVALIIRRAISGIGCAGLLSGTLIIIARSFAVHKRPIYTGMIGGMAGVAGIIAPTLGGALTDNAIWRWCFWINLPLGAITAVVVFFPSPSVQLLNSMDPIGTVLLMPFMVCLLLALQWGDTTYAWSNWRIILCLCLFGVLFLAWLGIQYYRGDDATLPLRLIRQRSVASGMAFMLGVNGAVFVIVYYVSIRFQVVKDTTAEQSGINFLTSSTAVSVSSILSGVLTSKFGYWVPQMIFSTIVTSISSGLIFRYEVETTTAYWAGTLFMFGFGAGMGMQMPLAAIQTVLKGADVSLGTSSLILAQTLAGSIFLSVAQSLFQSRLLVELAAQAPQVDAQVVIGHGASGIKDMVAQRYGDAAALDVFGAYNHALRACFLLCIVLSCLTGIGALGTEWRKTASDSGETPRSDI